MSGFSSLQSDYSMFFFYPVEVLLLLAAVFFIPLRKVTTTRFPVSGWLVWLFIFSMPSFFVGIDKNLSLFVLLRCMEAGLLAFMLRSDTVLQKKCIAALLMSLALQGILAAMQFVLQHSIGLPFLGESVFDPLTFNTARLLAGPDILTRAYGTFPHPNILGGFLATGSLLLILCETRLRSFLPAWLSYVLFSLMLTGLFFSFSRSAYLVFITGLILIFIFKAKKRDLLFPALLATLIFTVLIFLFPFVNSRFENAQTENTTRINQYEYALENSIAHPLGVGVGNSVLSQEQDPTDRPLLWNLQPIHNTFLLLIYELGIIAGMVVLIGYIGFIRIAFGLRDREFIVLPLALIIPLMTDHYLVTSFQGLMLLSMTIGIVLSRRERPSKTLVESLSL